MRASCRCKSAFGSSSRSAPSRCNWRSSSNGHRQQARIALEAAFKAASGASQVSDKGSKGAEMKIVSLNVGLPVEVTWMGRTVTTGIYKEPVAGRVQLRTLNLDGDRQADLTVHGG